MGVRGKYNIKLIKNSKAVPITESTPIKNINSFFFIPPVKKSIGNLNRWNNNSMNKRQFNYDESLVEAVDLWKTLLPVPDDINEFELMKCLYVLDRQYYENKNNICSIRTPPFFLYEKIINYLIEKKLLISTSLGAPQNDLKFSFSPDFEKFSGLMTHSGEAAVPFVNFGDKTILEYEGFREANKEAFNLASEFTFFPKTLQIEVDGDKYSLGYKYNLDKNVKIGGLVIDNDNQTAITMSSNKVTRDELATEHYSLLLGELSHIIKQAKNSKLVLEPFAVTNNSLVFYAMEKNQPVYARIAKNVIADLYKKYGEDLDFRIQSADYESIKSNRISVISNNKLVASIYPKNHNNIIREYSESSILPNNDFLSLNLIFETISLMRNK